MKTYPKYLIKLDAEDTPKFLDAVERALCKGWKRRPDFPYLCGESYYVFQRNRRGQPPLRLFILRDDSETLSVVNIVPREGGLTHDQYTAVLLDFQASVLEKVLDAGFDITLLLCSDEVRIERLMHPADLKQLRRFAILANKDTGSHHLCDRDRWILFLIGYYRSHRDGLAPCHLDSWFRERGFSSTAVSNLVHEFDFALDLLKSYDACRARLAQHPPAVT